MRIACFTFLLGVAAAVPAEAQTYYPAPPRQNTRSLGILGGLAGAGIGAAVGEDGGDALPGALIGGAIGALGGSVLGSGIDQEQSRQRVYGEVQRQQYLQAVTPLDVIQMSQAGLADQVIITQMRTRGVRGSLQTADLIALKQQGVSDGVLQAMQQLSAPAGQPVITPAPRPVIIHERVYPSHWHREHWHHDHWHAPARKRTYMHFHYGR